MKTGENYGLVIATNLVAFATREDGSLDKEELSEFCFNFLKSFTSHIELLTKKCDDCEVLGDD